MKELELKDGSKIKYKEFLTEAEYITLINVAIDAYKNGLGTQQDDLGIIPYNPIKASQAFNRALLDLCIEGYSDDDYEKYFEENIPNVLIDMVTNAYEAWAVVVDLIDKSVSMPMIVNTFLNKLLDIIDGKLPDGANMEKLLKKLPKDMSKAISDYLSIKNATKAEFTEKLENGEYADLEKKEIADKN